MMFPIVLALMFLIQGAGIAQPLEQISVSDPSINVLVVGDWGRHGAFYQRDVAASMERAAQHFDAAAVVSTGDNFYPDGVQSTTDPAWRASFEEIYTGHHLHCTWYSAFGNHDYHGNVQAQIDYSQISRRWRVPSRYFVRTLIEEEDEDTISLELIIIDTNPFQSDYRDRNDGYYGDIDQQDTLRQKQWLDSVLSRSTSTYTVVIGHHPMYTGGKRKGKTGDMIDAFHHLFTQRKIDAYIAGHEHDLQHHDDKSGVHYFVSGAGSEVRPTGDMEFTRFAKSTGGFAVLSATNKGLVVRFVDSTGAVLYSVTLPRR